MRIVRLEREPFSSIVFLNASRSGRAETERLPLTIGYVGSLPPGLRALLVAGDLQGVVPDWSFGGRSCLLGERLAAVYAELAGDGRVPPPESTGVILPGDFYSAPDASKRGATGDVRSVWNAFADGFRWVAGVAGNHDEFGTAREEARFAARPRIHLLDGRSANVDGIEIGGVSGVIGPVSKPRRREEDSFIGVLKQAVKQQPAILVLHEGPNGERAQRGNPRVRETIMASRIR